MAIVQIANRNEVNLRVMDLKAGEYAVVLEGHNKGRILMMNFRHIATLLDDGDTFPTGSVVKVSLLIPGTKIEIVV
jgi:hypothetical protein